MIIPLRSSFIEDVISLKTPRFQMEFDPKGPSGLAIDAAIYNEPRQIAFRREFHHQPDSRAAIRQNCVSVSRVVSGVCLGCREVGNHGVEVCAAYGSGWICHCIGEQAPGRCEDPDGSEGRKTWTRGFARVAAEQ